jgi:hypothetical protein
MEGRAAIDFLYEAEAWRSKKSLAGACPNRIGNSINIKLILVLDQPSSLVFGAGEPLR